MKQTARIIRAKVSQPYFYIGSLFITYTTGEPTVTPDEIAQFILIITSLRSQKYFLASFTAPYVEVSLVHEGRILKQKKTITKEPNRNPVFNETLTFHIPIGILHQTSLMLAVKTHNAKKTEDEVLGKILLGPATTGNQFEHWNEMRINNKPIARWHKLLD